MISVASYCRVSTDKEDQANSFAAQQRYFSQYIRQHPQWELYRIYADEGITGTSTKRRVAFQRMIQDAQAGKFRIILTKEVSRFSRNLLGTIAYTRKLKALGVSVLFLTDGINTMDPDAELRLSIMASIAQEESRRTSARVKWGQTRQMERGVVFGRSMLGYDVKDGVLSINPEGARLVQRIFHLYGVEKLGTTQIARMLEREGVRVERAENGRVAVERFRESPMGHYDAVLMDIRMPEMDGLSAASRIRALDRPDARAVPILAMTADAFGADVQRALAAGMNDHLAKPIEPAQLYRALACQLRRTA